MPTPAFSTPQVSLPAGSTSTGAGTAIAVNHCSQVQFTVIWAAGSAAGEVIAEGATASDYAGLWSEIRKFTFSAASIEEQDTFPGPFQFVRMRVSSAVTSGSVTGLVQGFVGP